MSKHPDYDVALAWLVDRCGYTKQDAINALDEYGTALTMADKARDDIRRAVKEDADKKAGAP